eukprot:366013-Chlamydomonas_euryale.AAC.9
MALHGRQAGGARGLAAGVTGKPRSQAADARAEREHQAYSIVHLAMRCHAPPRVFQALRGRQSAPVAAAPLLPRRACRDSGERRPTVRAGAAWQTQIPSDGHRSSDCIGEAMAGDKHAITSSLAHLGAHAPLHRRQHR